MIFIGEPLSFSREKYLSPLYAPIGQFGLFHTYFIKEQDEYTLGKLLQAEYLAIVETMLKMEVDFRVIYCHVDKSQNMQTISKCINMKNKDLLFSFDKGRTPFSVMYPNLLSLKIKNFILVNDEAEPFFSKIKNKENIWVSYYGNGAMTIADNDYIFVAQKQVRGEYLYLPDPAEIKAIEDRGVNINFLPLPAVIDYKFFGKKKKVTIYSDDNLDDVLALIKDKNGKEYLLIDPNMKSYVWDEKLESPCLLDSQETIREIKTPV